MAQSKKIIIIGLSALIIYLLMSSKSLAKPTSAGKIRACDPFGCGSFGASRGNHIHQGEDFIASPGETVFSPISGTVTRFPFPYGTDLSYRGIEIKNDEYSIKIFYMNATVAIGKTVKAGEAIGKAQNIAAKYGASMINHIHVEVRNKAGILIQPSKLF